MKIAVVVLVLVLGVCVQASPSTGKVHDEGHTVGHTGKHEGGDTVRQVEGVKVGHDEGQKVGQEEGHKVRQNEGGKVGHDEGHTVGLKAGQEEGHKVRHEDGHKVEQDEGHKVGDDVKDNVGTRAGHEGGHKEGHEEGDDEKDNVGIRLGHGGGHKEGHEEGDNEKDNVGTRLGHDGGHKEGHEEGDDEEDNVGTRLGHGGTHKKGHTEPRHDVGARARHMKLVYGWSEIDYVFPDERTRDAAIVEESFIPGNSVPIGVDVDPVTGRVFVSMPRIKPGNAASLATVSKKKGFGEEHMLSPYPSWAWHKHGDCEGITSVYRVFVDECRRLWVLDTGNTVADHTARAARVCPPQILVFDLTNDQIIKRYEFPDEVLKPESLLVTIVVDVRDTARKCKDTYAYVADVTGFGLIVYNHAKGESWRVTANAMYPYPPFGLFDIHGSQFDLMDGILGLALTPKQRDVDRTLYFHSLASNAESWVATSVLRNKTNFIHGGNKAQRQFYTSPGKRSGQAAAESFDDNGVLFFSVLPDMTINCWNTKKEYTANNLVVVDRDKEAFQFIAGLKVVKNQMGVSELWVVSSRLQRHMTGAVENNDVNYRVMKASVDKLVQGTSCAVPKKPPPSPAAGRPPSGGSRPPSGGARPPSVKPGGSYNG